jgi:hypothetical protein
MLKYVYVSFVGNIGTHKKHFWNTSMDFKNVSEFILSKFGLWIDVEKEIVANFSICGFSWFSALDLSI